MISSVIFKWPHPISSSPLSSGITRCHSSSGPFPVLVLELPVSPGNLVPFSTNKYLENEIWVLDVLIAAKVVLLHFEVIVHFQLCLHCTWPISSIWSWWAHFPSCTIFSRPPGNDAVLVFLQLQEILFSWSLLTSSALLCSILKLKASRTQACLSHSHLQLLPRYPQQFSNFYLAQSSPSSSGFYIPLFFPWHLCLEFQSTPNVAYTNWTTPDLVHL